MAESLLGAMVRLTSAVETLAALAAQARVRAEGLAVDPAIGESLAGVSGAVLGPEVAGTAEAVQAIGMARAFLRESIALIDDPGRTGAWATADPAVLQSVGRLSMSIAPVIAHAADRLDVLGAALSSPGARILDVGTGTGWLAVALARAFPNLEVVGIDIHPPALALARENVEREGLATRITLLECDVTALKGPDTFDAVWLPLPFLPKDLVPKAVARASEVLAPGGWLLPGTFAGPDDELSRLLTDLRILRSGGYPWSASEILAILSDAGLSDCSEVERVWPAPLRLFCGRHT